MRVSIDPGKCTGHGLCYMTAPDVYVDDEQGYGKVINESGELAPEQVSEAKQGAENCPEQAITLS